MASFFLFGSDKKDIDEPKGDNATKEHATVDEVTQDEVTTIDTQQTLLSLKEKYPNARIDVEGIGRANPMKAGSTYHVSLLNVEESLNGEWVSNDFGIYNEQVTPKKSGPCTLLYIVNGDRGKVWTSKASTLYLRIEDFAISFHKYDSLVIPWCGIIYQT